MAGEETITDGALDRTQEVVRTPPSVEERTQALAAPPPAVAQSQEQQDRRLASELSQRGVPPDEIQRLLAMGRDEPATAPASKARPPIVSPPTLPASEPFVPKPSITLPELREPSVQERLEAERRLTAANVARRRGLYKQAEIECRAAIELAPGDAPALEQYADILQGLGKVDDAAFVYKRALEIDPTRKTAEKKYAELTLMQNRGLDALRIEYIPRDPRVAVILSLLFPGAGQLYNGDVLKGLVLGAVGVGCWYSLLFTDIGFWGSQNRITTSTIIVLAGLGVGYLVSALDANLSARRGRKLKSGWDL